MQVQDIMTPAVLTVTPDTPLKKVNQLLHRYHLNDLVVVDENNAVVGIITYSDLFRQILPSYEEVMKDESYWLNPDALESRALQIMENPVKNYMTTNVVTVSPDKPAVHAGALMIAKKVKQLPVVNNGKLVGIVSYTDITWGLMIKNCKFF